MTGVNHLHTSIESSEFVFWRLCFFVFFERGAPQYFNKKLDKKLIINVL
jgi:hypothetical protein